MNTSLTVKLAADTNFIPVKYSVVEMLPASTAATTYCVLETVEVGWDTELHYDDWVAHKVYAPLPSPPVNPLTPIQPVQGDYINLAGRFITGMQGTVGALSITTLDLIVIYTPATPSTDM